MSGSKPATSSATVPADGLLRARVLPAGVSIVATLGTERARSPIDRYGSVTLVRREKPLLAEAQRKTFHRLVKQAFSQRRKMMLKLLKQNWPKEQLEPAFAALNISPQERAEKLSLEQFVALTEKLCPLPA